MKFTGRIKNLLAKREGTSQRTGEPWVAQEFIFEYFEHPTDRYSDSVVLDTIDAEAISKMKPGITVRVDFGHSVREYNGKFYNSLRCYKIEFAEDVENNPVQGNKTSQAVNTSQEEKITPQNEGNSDDLPF